MTQWFPSVGARSHIQHQRNVSVAIIDFETNFSSGNQQLHIRRVYIHLSVVF